ncbi:hypothetical protein DEJ46_27440 [Streptomyces venezuelae]|uniref:Uncharacterized protein n=2 Tax=Streptomyces TaxID=1883 RepID=A0A5P2AXI1_STRVZ|nr:hypothetical protein DEJ46_27440 [Streptomyces venezuelae]
MTGLTGTSGMRGEGGMREHDDVEAALAAALRPSGVDDASAQEAVAAFRAARDTGLHGSRRTRRREDWRPVPERGTGRPLRTALAALAASLTLGGVAFAAAASHDSFDEPEVRVPEPRSSTTAPAPSREPASPASASPAPSSPALEGAPATPRVSGDPARSPRSSEAFCRTYEKSLDKDKGEDKGKAVALAAAARERLIAAADGKDVATYCDSLLASAEPHPAGGNGAPAKSPLDTRPKPEAGHSVHHPPAPVVRQGR